MPDRREQGATRRNILQLIRRRGAMTAQEISDALGIGAVGVRQHLAMLERDGQVRVVGLRRSVGRPSNLYALTSEAERCFPKHYDRLALDLVIHLEEMSGSPAVEQVLARRRQAQVNEWSPHFVGKARAERVATLARLLAEQGYMCEWEQQEDGSFILTEYNCPIDCVARRYPQLCDQEQRLYEALLGTPITREITIADGGLCCRYYIPSSG